VSVGQSGERAEKHTGVVVSVLCWRCTWEIVGLTWVG